MHQSRETARLEALPKIERMPTAWHGASCSSVENPIFHLMA